MEWRLEQSLKGNMYKTISVLALFAAGFIAPLVQAGGSPSAPSEEAGPNDGPVGLKMWCCRRDPDTKMCVKICNSPPINMGPECTPCLYGCIDGHCKDPPAPGR